MSPFPPSAVLLVMLSAIVCVIVVDAPLIIVAFSSPAALAVLTSAQGRRTFGRRLLVAAPLIAVAIALPWCAHGTVRDSLLPALRIVSALAWASCLSTWLEPREMRAALLALGVPAAFVELMAHTRRFATQLAQTASEAWHAATLRAGLGSLRATIGTAGQVAGVVVVRAFDRAECVAIASALRGAHLAEDPLLEERPVSQPLAERP